MKSLTRLAIAGFLVVTWVGAGSISDAIIQKLRSSDWTIRAEGVKAITAQPNWEKDPAVIKTLTDLLNHENELVDAAFRSGTGAAVLYGESYDDPYLTVLSEDVEKGYFALKDQDALGALIRSSYSGDSPFAGQLAAQGDRAVPELLKLSRSDLAPVRENAVAVLGRMLALEKSGSITISQSNHSAARSAIAKATKDPFFPVRIEAVHQLGNLGDRSDISLLTEIEANDPATRTEGQVGFPVREAARDAIDAIVRGSNRNTPTR